MKIEDIVIDPEFKQLIPPLSESERQQLENNLIADGCREPLTVWAEQGILLDGHNRLAICTEHEIECSVVTVKIPDREHAADWIDANQLGRRNLSPDAAALLRGRRYNRVKKPQGGRAGREFGTDILSTPNTAETLAKQHGVNEKTIRRDGEFASLVAEHEKTDPDIGRKVLAGEVKRADITRAIKEERREERREVNREKVGATVDILKIDAKFATIVIDPPWDWGDEGDCDQLGRAKPTYATMNIAELEALPVDTLADEDCHIYLWITNRSLPKGFRLLDAWGFRYVTALTWCKPSFGMGNYFRGSTEHVLFGVKGSQPLKRKDVGTWFEAPRGEGGHSSKPDKIYDLVESCSPGPYLEMFARHGRIGRLDWTAWGAEA